MRWCWVNFQSRGVLLTWIKVGQGPAALAVGAGGGCLDIFSLIYDFYLLSPSLWETARYRLKYCLKGPLNPNQPTKFNLTDQKEALPLSSCRKTKLHLDLSITPELLFHQSRIINHTSTLQNPLQSKAQDNWLPCDRKVQG